MYLQGLNNPNRSVPTQNFGRTDSNASMHVDSMCQNMEFRHAFPFFDISCAEAWGFEQKKVEKSRSFQLQATFWKLYKVLLEILTHRNNVHWCFLDGFHTKF